MKFIGSFLGGILAGLVAVVIAALLLAIVPAVYVFAGWIIGWIIAWLFGTIVTDGINALFGTGITPSDLPLVTAGLALIASFFRANITTNKAGE